MSRPAEAPIACQLKALDAPERARQRELLGIVREKIRRIVELVNGFELSLPPDPGTLAEAAEWVELERRCCAFADLAIEQREDAIFVRVTGGPGAKEVLAAEMGFEPGAASS